jgi:hypothetical protein
MRERLKSILLFLLVGTSILLTGRLLFGQPALETAAPPSYEELIFGELRNLTDMALPALRLGEGEQWQLLYSWDEGHAQAWSIFLDLIRYADAPQLAGNMNARPGLSAYAAFNSPVQPGWWIANSTTATFEVTEIAWFDADPLIVWLKDKDGVWYTCRVARLPDAWEAQFMEAFSAAEDTLMFPGQNWEPLTVHPEAVILIPRELPPLASYTLKREDMNTEKLLRSIFVNIAMVRKIEERDGAVIYTDGQQGLRLFAHGEMEYTSPKSEPGLDPMVASQALRRVAQYLQFMGGWPDYLYIEKYFPQERNIWNIRQGDTYTVIFTSVQNGVRLVSPEPPLTLRFTDRGVIDFRRHLVQLDMPAGVIKELTDPRQSAPAVATVLEGFEEEMLLQDVYLAYNTGGWPQGQAVARPVWVYSFNNGLRVLIDARTGEALALQP